MASSSQSSVKVRPCRVTVTNLRVVYVCRRPGDYCASVCGSSRQPVSRRCRVTEPQWTFYLAHYCGHMLRLCCRAFSFQYYRGQTGCDWLPLPEPPDYILGLEPGIMKSAVPTGTGPAAYSWTLKAAVEGSGINSGGRTLRKRAI